MVHEEKSSPEKTVTQKIGLLLGVVLFFGILLFPDLDPGNPAASRMTAVAVLMAIWWITDAIPLYATALLPMMLFPLTGILSGSQTAPIYINSTIFLFIGGFMIALAIIVQMESRFDTRDTAGFSTGLMLGIAYACSVGGVATIVV